MASYTVTPSQILEHRAGRKAAGLLGCITSKPKSDKIVFGFSDVYSWRPADPMNPHCFCIDCRDLWDKDAAVDAELVNNGHKWACETYASLLPNPPAPSRPATPPSPLPARTLTEHPEAYARGVPRSFWFPGTPPPRVEIPPPPAVPRLSLPAPRHRDIMNESRKTRIKKDLLELITDFHAELISVMDSRRQALNRERPSDSDALLREIDRKESELWDKIKAAELLVETLDV